MGQGICRVFAVQYQAGPVAVIWKATRAPATTVIGRPNLPRTASLMVEVPAAGEFNGRLKTVDGGAVAVMAIVGQILPLLISADRHADFDTVVGGEIIEQNIHLAGA